MTIPSLQREYNLLTWYSKAKQVWHSMTTCWDFSCSTYWKVIGENTCMKSIDSVLFVKFYNVSTFFTWEGVINSILVLATQRFLLNHPFLDKIFPKHPDIPYRQILTSVGEDWWKIDVCYFFLFWPPKKTSSYIHHKQGKANTTFVKSIILFVVFIY